MHSSIVQNLLEVAWYKYTVPASVRQFTGPVRTLTVGVTSLLVGGWQALLTEALAVAETELMGGCGQLWPLTKVLDIGGDARKGRYLSASAGAGGM